MADGPKLLELRNIHVSYGSVTALDGVDFDLYAGEIHGLVGEHRAGKSTLVKVLSGAARVEDGSVLLEGRRVDQFTPKSSLNRGIGIVYQDLSVIPHLDAVENIFTGRMLRRRLVGLDHAAMEREATAILHSLQCTFDVHVPLAKLKPAHQHMVELARALALGPQVLILDELSNKLTPEEMKVVYRAVLDLREHGSGIIYISHDMDEILRLADRVTVLRGGHRRLTAEVRGLDRLQLHELTYSFRIDELQNARGDPPLLRLKRDLQSFIQVLPVGVVLLDERGACQLYNLAAHELCGMEEHLPERGFVETLSALADDRAAARRLTEMLAGAEPFRIAELKLRTGKTMAIAGAPVGPREQPGAGTLLVLEDVSMARYMNEAVMENAKVSTVARLAVGVAHEMNNPLFAIQNYLEVIRGRVQDPEVQERLTRIEREVTRISEIVTSLLSFSRAAPAPRTAVDVQEIVGNAVILLQHAFREKSVAVDVDFPPRSLRIEGDENRLTQVVLNLTANAVDAVLNGGHVRIGTREGDDGWIELQVGDDGCGIPEDVASRVFDPFFTTKLTRRNTGLGLSICRSIVEDHGGTIAFESRPGAGTTFVVRLPAAS